VAWQHVALVRELRVPAVSKLLLYALASRADNSDRCWPSVRRLCVDTGLSRRAVQLHIARLIDSGMLVREQRAGRSNRFRIVLNELTALHSKGVNGATTPRNNAQSRTASAYPDAARPLPRPRSFSRMPHVIERSRDKDVYPQKGDVLTSRFASKATAGGSATPWWRTTVGVMQKGAELGLSPNPGEPFRTYKDRVFTSWEDVRRNPDRGTHGGQ
jgi:hypothetical protein